MSQKEAKERQDEAEERAKRNALYSARVTGASAYDFDAYLDRQAKDLYQADAVFDDETLPDPGVQVASGDKREGPLLDREFVEGEAGVSQYWIVIALVCLGTVVLAIYFYYSKRNNARL